MINNEYVSIILPTYNRANTIEAAIFSVLNQTYNKFELIVVDDGSQDETRKIVEAIDDIRVRYIYLDENKGPSRARNVGIECAKYNLLAFEDSDDIWHQDKLEKQIVKLNSDNYGLVYCSYEYIRNREKYIIPREWLEDEKVEGYIFKSLIEFNKIGTPTMLVKRECIDEVGLFNEELGSSEDWEFVLRIAEKFKIGYVREPLVTAYYTKNSVDQNVKKRLACLLYVFNKYKNEDNIFFVRERIFETLAILDSQNIKDIYAELKHDIAMDYGSFENYVLQKKITRKKNLQLKIINEICSNSKWNEFIRKYSIRKDDTIGIYGAGYVGNVLANLLSMHGMKVEYLIDKNKSTLPGYTVYKPENVQEKVDILFVTTDENIVIEEYFQYGAGRVINIFDLCKDI